MIQIGRAKCTDVDKIMKIMNGAVDKTKPDWYAIDDRDFVYRHINDEGFTLLAFCKCEIIGFIIVRFPKLNGDNLGMYISLDNEELLKVAHMESVAIDKKYIGLKLQQRLMIAAEKLINKAGYKYIMATAHPDNKFSVNNLNALNYKIVAEDIKYGGLTRLIFLLKG